MTKGRKLPPLLPLEYCRIDRAARMLGCEVEDIIHWGIIGAIKLAVRVELEGRLRVHPKYAEGLDFTDAGSLAHSFHCMDLKSLLGQLSSVVWLSHDEMKAFATRYIEQREYVASKGYKTVDEAIKDMTGEEDNLPSFSCFYDINGELLEASPSPDMLIPCASYGLWLLSFDGDFYRRFESEDSLEISPLVIGHADLESITLPATYKPIYEDLNLWDMGVDFETKETATFRRNDLMITKADLEKLHHSITTGEPLPNTHNNAELAQRAREQKANVPRTRAPRTEPRQSEMIRALLLLHSDITEEQLATPHKLHGILTEIFKATGSKAIMPDIPPETFARWLKK